HTHTHTHTHESCKKDDYYCRDDPKAFDVAVRFIHSLEHFQEPMDSPWTAQGVRKSVPVSRARSANFDPLEDTWTANQVKAMLHMQHKNPQVKKTSDCSSLLQLCRP
ncbi:hypothetical protein DUNSADRAFT_16584, partial [Dunaliella salina]